MATYPLWEDKREGSSTSKVITGSLFTHNGFFLAVDSQCFQKTVE